MLKINLESLKKSRAEISPQLTFLLTIADLIEKNQLKY